ncbi:MAG TPA: hypothetical protein DEF41_15470 [Desulfovibrio sp.]|jgi:hypothetical protein|nr:hypothetical protein [Desulfovibrio sp.]
MDTRSSLHTDGMRARAMRSDEWMHSTAIGRISQAVCKAYGVSYDMSCVACLAAINSALRGKVSVRVNADWVEPANAFIVLCAESGAGKSPVNAFFKAPLLSFQKNWNDTHKVRLCLERSRQTQLRKRVAALERKIAKLEDKAQIEKCLQEMTELREKAPCMPSGHELEIFVDECTNASLIECMRQQGGRLAVMEGEASLFRHIVNAKPMSPIVDTLLKAFSGERIQSKKSGEDSIVIEHPVLALNVMVQPPVIVQLGRNKDIVGRGLLGRILSCVIEPSVAGGDVGGAVPKGIKVEYSGIIEAILERVETSNEQIVLELDTDALRLWDVWRDKIESARRLRDEYAPVWGEWRGKAARHLLHIAVFLHMFEYPESRDRINANVMQLAVQMADSFYEHYEKIVRLIYPERGEKIAIKALGSAMLYGQRRFQSRDLQRMFGVHRQEANAAIDWLWRRDAIRERPPLLVGRRGGRPSSPEYEIVDDVWDDLVTECHGGRRGRMGGLR